MGAQDATSVVVSIEAQTADLDSNVRHSEQVFDSAMSGIEQSAIAAERQIVVSSQNSSAALERVSTTSGATRAGLTQLSYQLGDVAQGFALGVSPMTIFAQQGGQVIQAIQLMSGEASGLLGFLGGPWGIVLTGAATVVGTLAAGLLSSKGAGENARAGYLAAADGAEALANALQRVNSLGGIIAKQDVFDIQQGIVQKQAEIANIQKQIDATRGTGRVINILGPAERFTATRDLNAAKDELTTLQNSLQIAQQRVNVQDRIQSAQDKYQASRAKEPKARAVRTSTPKDTAKEIDLVADASKGATDAINRLSRALVDEPNTISKAQQSAFNNIIGSNGLDDIISNAKTSFDAAQTEQLQNEHDLQAVREQHVRDLSGLYLDLFTGGTKSLWQDFERMGLQIIAKLLAEWTINSFMPSGGASGGGLGGLLSSLGSAIGLGGGGPSVDVGAITANTNSLLAAGLPGLAGGGMGIIGGNGGIDGNVLSINGQPQLRVGKGEVLSVTPSGRTPRAAMGSGGGTVVHQYFTLDARYGITTPELLRGVSAAIQNEAGKAGATAYQKALTDAPGALRKNQQFVG